MDLEIFKKESYSEKRINGSPQPDPRPTPEIMKLIQSHVNDVQGLLDEMTRRVTMDEENKK